MDTTKCRVLICAVETGSFTAAADKLGYTPSGVSRMMAALEEETGFLLLQRGRAGVTPTENCLRLLPLMRHLVGCDGQLENLAKEMSGLRKGSITIGVSFSLSSTWLPTMISKFLNECPGIEIHTIEGGGEDLCTLLENRQVDFCIMSRRLGCGHWTQLTEEPLVAWLPKDHPMASLSSLPIKAYFDEPFILGLPGRNTDAELLLQRCGISPRISFTASDNFGAYSMVEAGLGISINNAMVAQRWTGNVAVLPLEPQQKVSIGIASPEQGTLSPAAEKFITYTIALASELK